MDSENLVVYESLDTSEPALIVKVAEPASPNKIDLSISSLDKIIEPIGLTKDSLLKYLKKGLSLGEGELRNEVVVEGVKIEDIVVETVNNPQGPLEIAAIKLYPEVVKGQGDTGLHLKVGEKGGFEIIYVYSGEATLSFPEVTPIAMGVYGASQEKRANAVLRPGTLAIIPAPTANGWSEVKGDFRFVYLCQPPWSSDFVVPALDL